MSDFKIAGVNVFAASTITKNTSISSEAIKLAEMKAKGYNGIQFTSTSTATTGTILGQVTVCATEEGTYTVPRDKDGNEIDPIVVAHADGQQYYGFPSFPIAPFMKIKATENNINNILTFEGRLTTQ